MSKVRAGALKIIFMGSDSFIVPVVASLQENFQVLAVVTAPDSAVSKIFQGKILTPDKLDEQFSSKLKTLNPDLIVVSSYGKIIPQDIWDIPKYGALNVHPSLLPKLRGASPVPTAILEGVKKTGVTIIKMDGKMDHGPIVSTKSFSLSGQEIFPDLITFLFQEGAKLLVSTIPDFVSEKLKPKVQDHTKATFCKLLKREDGYFDLDYPPTPEKLSRMVRAFYPWPGVWTKWNNKIVKFFPEGKVQMEGKKIMPLPDFLNGYPDFPKF